LHGLPVTIKDCFEVAGLPAANGSRARSYLPERHAPAVQRLVDAGAVVIGKSNVPLHSLDLQTASEDFGVTRNPWNPQRTPGGSSGGAAVALATGIVALELGTDLAGSLRVPAHATGVCSLKPSYGIVPLAGVLSPEPGRLRPRDLTVAGPLARTVADLELLLGLIAGPAGHDAAAWRLELPRAPGARPRIAAWLDDPCCPVEPGVAHVIETACAALEAEGFVVDREARPGLDPAQVFRDFCQLMYGEMSSGFPEPVYRSFALAGRRGVEGPWDPLRAMPGGVTQSHREWLAACERRERHRLAWDDFFARFDVLLAPVSPATALAHDERPFEERRIRLRGREYPYLQQAFWCSLATVAALPAAVVPAGVAADGLPVGVQIIAPFLRDYVALECARTVEKVCGGFRQPPEQRPFTAAGAP
jgi:amidase